MSMLRGSMRASSALDRSIRGRNCWTLASTVEGEVVVVRRRVSRAAHQPSSGELGGGRGGAYVRSVDPREMSRALRSRRTGLGLEVRRSRSVLLLRSIAQRWPLRAKKRKGKREGLEGRDEGRRRRDVPSLF
jgi:hypothetical protein